VWMKWMCAPGVFVGRGWKQELVGRGWKQELVGCGWKQELAAVCPGWSTDPGAVRLSGMGFRAASFTATAPDGAGNLVLADKKMESSPVSLLSELYHTLYLYF